MKREKGIHVFMEGVNSPGSNMMTTYVLCGVLPFPLKGKQHKSFLKGTVSLESHDRQHTPTTPLHFLIDLYVLFVAWIKVINVTNHDRGSSFLFLICYIWKEKNGGGQ